MHAGSVSANSLISRRKAILDYLQGTVWVLPLVGVVVGLGSGAILSLIPVKPDSLIDKLMFQGTAGDARGVLTVVSATMITTIGIVFSLTVLSLQIASSQFSVRLLRTFLRDMPNQMVLAMFACTFAYSTGGLHTVGQHADGSAFLPKVAVTGSLALAFLSIGALIYFLHHLMHSIQLDTIMDNVGQRTLGLIDDLYPRPDTPDRRRETPPTPPAEAVALLAPQSGYLQIVDTHDIVAAARPVGTRCCWSLSSATTSPPGACWVGAGAAAARRARRGRTFSRTACATCTSATNAPCNRTVGLACASWLTSRCEPCLQRSTTRTRQFKSCITFRPWSRCWRPVRCETRCAAIAPGSCCCGWSDRILPPTCTSDVLRSAATGYVNRWC